LIPQFRDYTLEDDEEESEEEEQEQESEDQEVDPQEVTEKAVSLLLASPDDDLSKAPLQSSIDLTSDIVAPTAVLEDESMAEAQSPAALSSESTVLKPSSQPDIVPPTSKPVEPASKPTALSVEPESKPPVLSVDPESKPPALSVVSDVVAAPTVVLENEPMMEAQSPAAPSSESKVVDPSSQVDIVPPVDPTSKPVASESKHPALSVEPSESKPTAPFVEPESVEPESKLTALTVESESRPMALPVEPESKSATPWVEPESSQVGQEAPQIWKEPTEPEPSLQNAKPEPTEPTAGGPKLPSRWKLPVEKLSFLYEQICEQEVDDGSFHRREMEYLDAPALVEKFKSMENNIYSLKAREDSVLKEGRRLGLVDKKLMYSQMGYRDPC
jgi:hypothetical protein